MNFLPFGLTLAQLTALGPAVPILVRARSIGPFIANITVEEQHLDELVITDHPVERNAVISDHAFKRPMAVVVTAGYSNSSKQAGGNPNYINDVYRAFLALQESRELITIITGKRFYSNMLIQRIMVQTDEKTENALFMRCECREVIIVTTQTVAFPPAQDQRNPAVTSPVQNRGTITVRPATGFNPSAAQQALPASKGYDFSPGGGGTGW